MNSPVGQIELQLMLEAIRLRYGYDFRNYSRESVERRFQSVLERQGYETLSDLQKRILRDPLAFERLLEALTVGTTQMFRDPSFFRALTEQVFPILATYPSLKIWHAGCSSGEEVYSLAVLLSEAGLQDRALIYATDINAAALEKASRGIYPQDGFQEAIQNYQLAGGAKSFSEYCHAEYGSVAMNPALKRNILFTQHNLVTDNSFGEMHLIVCRNVMIYFGNELQNRVLKLFEESLAPRGFLCLGRQESLVCTPYEKKYQAIGDERVYQRASDLIAKKGGTHATAT